MRGIKFAEQSKKFFKNFSAGDECHRQKSKRKSVNFFSTFAPQAARVSQNFAKQNEKLISAHSLRDEKTKNNILAC